MATAQERLAGDLLIKAVRNMCGKGISDRYKDYVRSEHVKAWLSAPFNPHYMDYTTTVGRGAINWRQGSRRDVEQREWWTFKVRAHEGQHMTDWPWLKWVYGLPHLLALVALVLFCVFTGWSGLLCTAFLVGGLALGYVMPKRSWWFIGWTALGLAACTAIAIWQTGWHALWILGAGLCISPLLNWLGAAWGRAIAELRGYTLSLAINYWRYGTVTTASIDWVVQAFTSGAYYYMLPWKAFVRSYFERQLKRFGSGEYQQSGWPAEVYRTLAIANMICRGNK